MAGSAYRWLEGTMCFSWTEAGVGKGEECRGFSIWFCGEGEVTHTVGKKSDTGSFRMILGYKSLRVLMWALLH